jgi:hypothetical protein
VLYYLNTIISHFPCHSYTKKPDNLGFDVRGDVKLFDFGLAKELDVKKKLEDGTYHLTADTGSLRYMAPGESCNVLAEK